MDTLAIPFLSIPSKLDGLTTFGCQSMEQPRLYCSFLCGSSTTAGLTVWYNKRMLSQSMHPQSMHRMQLSKQRMQVLSSHVPLYSWIWPLRLRALGGARCKNNGVEASSWRGWDVTIAGGSEEGVGLCPWIPRSNGDVSHEERNVVVCHEREWVHQILAATGPGGGVLDKPPPVIDRPTPGRESEFDLGVVRKKKQSPPYRVLLHNDNFNRREYVVQVLMKVIPSMTVDLAVNIMQEAHVNGMAVVIICGQDEAEDLCMQLRTNGLVSSIEPASS
eukprot:TRINITY_DN1382_c0_g1_i1.p1 TRINITY_DN1382_c0_g1~~TRINITY_DN1382_c0_g1_i1.p1  ORF type:complete len:293 (-),score=42.12 TRINITY_DN1382_c0_g1_i1:163-987(-)